eukprot:SAG31_NODE_3520_length_4165_cov_1.856370_1_plen_268_part_00
MRAARACGPARAVLLPWTQFSVAVMRASASLPCVLLALTTQTNAASTPCPSAADITRGAEQLCSISSSLAHSISAVGIKDGAAASLLLLLLQKHGFRTALDLRVLDTNGQESGELMEQLRVGGVSIGDRSKVRLLLSDQGRGQDRCIEIDAATKMAPTISEPGTLRQRRQLHDSGMSSDTIAIVLSVLIGAAGYLVQVSIRRPLAAESPHECSECRCSFSAPSQAYTSRRAERTLAEQAQEQHAHETKRQREHEQMLAQIARTDRCE